MARGLSIVQGKEVEITEFCLSSADEELYLKCKAFSEKSELTMHFYHVSHIRIKDFVFPMKIGGFEIQCNQNRGWERAQAYTIRDYEEESLRFFCRDFEIHKSMLLDDNNIKN